MLRNQDDAPNPLISCIGCFKMQNESLMNLLKGDLVLCFFFAPGCTVLVCLIRVLGRRQAEKET